MKIYRLLLIPVIAIIASCSSDSSNDGVVEQACTAATGNWYIQTYACDGVDQGTVLDVVMAFSAGNFAFTTGGESCQTTANFTMATGATAAELSLIGAGNVVCTANGSTTSTCSTMEGSCNNTNSVDTIDNSYTSCVISGGTMTMQRTINTTTANFSGCSSGAVEAITLSQTPVTLPAQLLILEQNPYDFGNVAVGGVKTRMVDLFNNTAVTVTGLSESGLSTPYGFNGGAYPGTGGDCGLTLAAGATCTLDISFAPVASGVVTDSIVIAYNDGAVKQYSHDVTGTGAAPAALIISESDPYDFGSVQAGMSSNHTFTVTNTGAVSAYSFFEIGLAAPFSLLGGTFPGTGGTCNSSTGLAAGANCTIVVNFAPTVVGAVADTINFQYYDGVTNQVVSRNVTGTGAP